MWHRVIFHHPIGFFGFFANGFFWIVFAGLLIFLLLAFSSDSEQSENNGDSPDNNNLLQIVKERYAKGEITKREFDQLKKNLLLKTTGAETSLPGKAPH